jgi:aspartyl aminopeptidase
LLHDTYGITEADFISAELSLVPAGEARDLGIDRSMILGYGHDDRVCAYTGLRGIVDIKGTPEYTAMCVLCDKEEIGSVGATGMNSCLFENVAAELINCCVDDYSDIIRRRALRASKMLSADVNAIHDPNYPEVSSPNDNMAKLNHGLVLTKYVGAGGKSGSNDASAEFMAEVRRIFDGAKVVWQTGEIGKVDQGGGGTIAFMLARYGMDVVDCGPALFSMHAPWEGAGKLDIFMAYRGYKAFYQSK